MIRNMSTGTQGDQPPRVQSSKMLIDGPARDPAFGFGPIAEAFATIIDTHLTVIISAIFLFQFGTGPVKGFAVTLILGLLISIFTAVFVSHTIFELTYGRRQHIDALSI